jgi:hypothetical protein
LRHCACNWRSPRVEWKTLLFADELIRHHTHGHYELKIFHGVSDLIGPDGCAFLSFGLQHGGRARSNATSANRPSSPPNSARGESRPGPRQSARSANSSNSSRFRRPGRMLRALSRVASRRTRGVFGIVAFLREYSRIRTNHAISDRRTGLTPRRKFRPFPRPQCLRRNGAASRARVRPTWGWILERTPQSSGAPSVHDRRNRRKSDPSCRVTLRGL